MTIKVTFQGRGEKAKRKEYLTFKKALSIITTWFKNNSGMVVVYQPHESPVIYHSLDDLPIEPSKPSCNFYLSNKWLALRAKVLSLSGKRCVYCGVSEGEGVVFHVDHIKPRSLFPELELELSNLQVLCDKCNIGKNNSLL